jgi:multicomponent Na+:H+ antiporter subunit E
VFDGRRYARNVLRMGIWAYAAWLLFTWTATAEQLIFGGGLALVVGLALAPLGDVAAPWSVLTPRRLVAIARLLGYVLVHVVRANLSLARRILAPARPLDSGMVVVPTTAETDGELTATGIITSLIVDNQIVDLDRNKRLLQYHVVAVPSGIRAEAINAPVERRVARVRRPR